MHNLSEYSDQIFCHNMLAFVGIIRHIYRATGNHGKRVTETGRERRGTETGTGMENWKRSSGGSTGLDWSQVGRPLHMQG